MNRLFSNWVKLSEVLQNHSKLTYHCDAVQSADVLHNVEHLALCLRFVDEKCDIREEFVTFVKLGRVRASDITTAITNTLEGFGLSLNEL